MMPKRWFVYAAIPEILSDAFSSGSTLFYHIFLQNQITPDPLLRNPARGKRRGCAVTEVFKYITDRKE